VSHLEYMHYHRINVKKMGQTDRHLHYAYCYGCGQCKKMALEECILCHIEIGMLCLLGLKFPVLCYNWFSEFRFTFSIYRLLEYI